jgi:uncharacterized membrane protein (UPF0127 family)
MVPLRFAATMLLCLALQSCVKTGSTVTLAAGGDTRNVTLPDGTAILAEVEIKPEDMARGMMYRDSIAPDRGMLFVHAETGEYPYWMANCKFPLDIIWMDSAHKVVEISAKTPPCPQGGNDCPNYGGHAPAQFVLELGGGQAARHAITVGSAIHF